MAVIASLVQLGATSTMAAVVPVGSGSYTTTFPGTDAAGRNALPPGTPNVSGNAAGKPVPTSDWWSNFLVNSFGGNCFNYPLNYQAKASGLIVNNTVPNATPMEYRQPISDVHAIVVGTAGLAASKASVSDYSDWTVTLSWDDRFKATLGQGMPFTYFTKATAEVAQVTVHATYTAGVTVSGNKLLVLNNLNGANFVVYGPAGSTWTANGGTYTSTLNGKNYWSMAMLPAGADVTATAAEFEKYAYVFPRSTQVAWKYTPATGVVRTTFTTTPEVKEGTSTTMLQGLLPHQWAHLAPDSPQPGSTAYRTVRGQLKLLASNTFVVENTFRGLLPTLPNVAKDSKAFRSVPGFDAAALTAKLDAMKNDALALWTDSYNEGQLMNRLVQAARIADQLGDTAARDAMVATVKTRLENWLTASAGEVALLFYYNTDWTTLIGYPSGHHTDDNLNDHHYHWGYFLNAAAAVEQFNPGWSAQWGGMVDLLVRDVASPSRTDALFPFLRNFNPYSGHSWGNGTSNQAFGVDQESTPEAMNFHAGLIQWALATGNDALRDLGVYLYTTELTAVEEYWFDVHRRTFQPAYGYPMVARLWSGGYDNGTWWTNRLSASYGIQLYPIHGGTLYLGNDPAYVQRVWDGILRDTGVMTNLSGDPNAGGDPDLWYDVLWCYQAFLDPEAALEGYHRWQGRNSKFGTSDAQTYHWLHSMHALGRVQSQVVPDYPAAAVFELAGVKTYAAHNFGGQALTVHFSDGFSLTVPARSMATSRDVGVGATVSLRAGAARIDTGGTVELSATVTGSGVTKVEFYRDDTLIGARTAAPYTLTTAALPAGVFRFSARVFVGDSGNLSNVVTVQVGRQLPYGGTAPVLPGSIQAGEYDVFEGGVGQGITYFDTTSQNEGGFRPTEAVDAGEDANGARTVGWIEAGEWLTYTVSVSQSGPYKLTVYAASAAAAGGGPLWLEVNGTKISPDLTVPFTGTSWTGFQPKVVDRIDLTAGTQVLRVVAGGGGFNLGRLVFEAGAPAAPAIQNPPVGLTVAAGATATFTVTATGTAPLRYQWLKDGAEIGGANGASYTTPATVAADSGSRFRVVVANGVGTVTSSEATLTVTAAVKPLDVNGDGAVDALDLAAVAAAWGTADAAADLDGNGVVDDADVTLWLAGF